MNDPLDTPNTDEEPADSLSADAFADFFATSDVASVLADAGIGDPLPKAPAPSNPIPREQLHCNLFAITGGERYSGGTTGLEDKIFNQVKIQELHKKMCQRLNFIPRNNHEVWINHRPNNEQGGHIMNFTIDAHNDDGYLVIDRPRFPTTLSTVHIDWDSNNIAQLQSLFVHEGFAHYLTVRGIPRATIFAEGPSAIMEHVFAEESDADLDEVFGLQDVHIIKGAKDDGYHLGIYSQYGEDRLKSATYVMAAQALKKALGLEIEDGKLKDLDPLRMYFIVCDQQTKRGEIPTVEEWLKNMNAAIPGFQKRFLDTGVLKPPTPGKKIMSMSNADNTGVRIIGWDLISMNTENYGKSKIPKKEILEIVASGERPIGPEDFHVAPATVENWPLSFRLVNGTQIATGKSPEGMITATPRGLSKDFREQGQSLPIGEYTLFVTPEGDEEIEIPQKVIITEEFAVEV